MARGGSGQNRGGTPKERPEWLTEEAEAIGWYEQRPAVERDPQAREIMRNFQEEEFKHFSMGLEFLLRRSPVWRVIA